MRDYVVALKSCWLVLCSALFYFFLIKKLFTFSLLFNVRVVLREHFQSC